MVVPLFLFFSIKFWGNLKKHEKTGLLQAYASSLNNPVFNVNISYFISKIEIFSAGMLTSDKSAFLICAA